MGSSENDALKLSLYLTPCYSPGSVTYNAIGAAKSYGGTEHTATINVAGGELDVIIKWEPLTEEEYTTFITDGGFAPEPFDGCWRPDGISECKTFEDMEASARRRLTEVCEVEVSGLE